MGGKPLNRKQLLAIARLIKGGHLDDAAHAVGVCPKTIDNWLTLPQFRAELNAAIDRVFELSISQASATVAESIATLETIRDSSDSANRDRIRASEILLTNAWKRRDLRLDERLTALEQANESVSHPAQN